jgi:hypothetical protein
MADIHVSEADPLQKLGKGLPQVDIPLMQGSEVLAEKRCEPEHRVVGSHGAIVATNVAPELLELDPTARLEVSAGILSAWCYVVCRR